MSLIHDRRGATAVEAALVLPVLLMLLLGVIEIGRLSWLQTGLNFAVQEAARCAAIQTNVCSTPAATAAYAAQKAAGLNLPASAFSVSTPACGVQVSAAVDYSFVAYRLVSSTPRVTARACRP